MSEEIKNEETQEEIKNEDSSESSKKRSINLKKILLIVAGILILIILAFIILYFLGYFEAKKEEKKPIIITQEKAVEKKKNDFDIASINSKKLNKQLSYLTNKNLSQETIEEKEKLEDEKNLLKEENQKRKLELENQKKILIKEKEEIEIKKLELENQKMELEKLRQAAINLKEELKKSKKELEEVKIPKIVVPKISSDKTIKRDTKTFLKMINVAKIKGNLYKNYLDKILKIDSNVKLCRDNKNKIEIYYGPFTSQNSRNKILNKLVKNNFKQSYAVELTQEEFDKRCNY